MARLDIIYQILETPRLEAHTARTATSMIRIVRFGLRANTLGCVAMAQPNSSGNLVRLLHQVEKGDSARSTRSAAYASA